MREMNVGKNWHCMCDMGFSTWNLTEILRKQKGNSGTRRVLLKRMVASNLEWEGLCNSSLHMKAEGNYIRLECSNVIPSQVR